MLTFALIILDVINQILNVGIRLFIRRYDQCELLFCSGNGYIQQMRVISEFLDLIINRGENNGVIFTALEFVDSSRNITASSGLNSCVKGVHLIIIRRNDTNICKLLF